MITDSLLSVFMYFRVGREHQDKDSYTYYRYPQLSSEKLSGDQLPPKDNDHIRIIVVADTHTRHKALGTKLPSFDVLVHCGDIEMTGRKFSFEYQRALFENFDRWIGKTIKASNESDLSHKTDEGVLFDGRAADREDVEAFVVAGNHDHYLSHLSYSERCGLFKNATYLENELKVTQRNGLRIFGCPISRGRSGNKAFQSEEFVNESCNRIEEVLANNLPIDILVTHANLKSYVERIPFYRLHLCGHFHAQYGVKIVRRNPRNRDEALQVCICAPICDASYSLTNSPIVVDYPISALVAQSEENTHEEMLQGKVVDDIDTDHHDDQSDSASEESEDGL